MIAFLLAAAATFVATPCHGQNPQHFATPPVFPPLDSKGIGWEAAFTKAEAFLSQLNLTQKASIVTGSVTGQCNGNIAPIPALNFSGLCLADGPLSVRIADLASVFPAGITAAATWDRDLIYQRGVALGEEFRGKGAHVHLGPVAGALGRHPLGGRNWEGFSPDPYLTGVAMDFSILGLQKTGVQACAKHFIGNEQETQRSNTISETGVGTDAISSNIDDRTMHELYLWPFANAVKSGVASVMCSYNRVNQTYACENSKILNGLLKEELGFQGYVVSDWFATHSGVRAVEAGLDMTMPGPIDTLSASIVPPPSFLGSNLTQAVLNGSLPESRVDDMVRRILTPYFYLNQNSDFPTVDPTTFFVLAATYAYPEEILIQLGLDVNNIPPARDVRADHANLIRKIGADGIVLLKNVNGTLPLRREKNIGVFGNDAADVTEGLTFTGDYSPPFGANIGTLSVGGGSGSGRNTYVVSPLSAIRNRTIATGARVQYLLDNHRISIDDFSSIFPTPEVCLVFLKSWHREGADRISFENDWNSTTIVQNVARRCPNTVVVTHSGGVNTMPWADNPNVTAILAAHYPGQESGNSIADVLFGDVNPSGRLPYTIPKSAADYDIPIVNLTGEQALDSSAWQSDFTEGLMIDYRHFDAKNITPLYEFGYGLSYTSFDLTAPLTVTRKAGGLTPLPPPSNSTHPGGNPALWEVILTLNTTVKNSGNVPGAQVVQLYLTLPQATVPSNTPARVLRGFEKVTLQPGQSAAVGFPLMRRDISFWNVTAQEWQIPQGEMAFAVGFSSRDIKETISDTAL